MDLAVHKIVAFCSSGMLLQTLAITFEANLEQVQIEFVDPYDSVWLKLITVLVYILQILSSIVMYTFVIYEKDYGHYRTLINQLISYIYKVVSTG